MTVQDVDNAFRKKSDASVKLFGLRKKIENGTATMEDAAQYQAMLSKILGQTVGENILKIPESERVKFLDWILRNQYQDANDRFAVIQQFLDKQQGIHIAPQKAPYPAERVEKLGKSLTDPTVPESTIQRRARAGTETVAKSFHDDYVKTNTKFRSRAGLKCYITRKAVSGCCAWCTAMAGRYEYGEEPDDVYRRHDNCDCTVTFENGRKRQDVWSKREWEAPEKDAGAGDSVVLTKEQAEVLKLKHRMIAKSDQQAIDFFAKGDILKGGYDERDIIRAIKQIGTNFVTKDINDPESVFGDLVESILPDPKYYDIKAHGSPTAVKLFGSVVDAQTLARVIVLREDYTGKPIRLLCCETGKEEGDEPCFAQQLADLLGVEVLAPTETFYASTTGRIKVESEKTGKKGEMKPFTPNKRGRK